MLKYILKRLAAGAVSLFVLVTITFFLMHAIPGGPFSPSEERNVPPQILERIADKYGLNEPIPVQYVKYLKNLLHGDMGTSFKKRDTTVNELIAHGFPISARVGAWGVALALAAGIPLGMVAAVKRGKLPDGLAMVFATIGVSVPSFVICVLMMYLFCEKWKIFPSYGLDSWRHYVLPVFCMAFSQIAYITRLLSLIHIFRTGKRMWTASGNGTRCMNNTGGRWKRPPEHPMRLSLRCGRFTAT